MPTPNPHLEEWMQTWEPMTGVPVAAVSAEDASFVLTQAIGKLNKSLQRGSYCSKAGSNFHVLLKAGIGLLNEANKIAQDQADGKSSVSSQLQKK